MPVALNNIALILAGGRGTRLSALATQTPKPAVPFGGDYRLIDFSLSNCCNSGIDTVGILTASPPFEICDRIGRGKRASVIHTLPPPGKRDAYSGTANAVYENIGFVDRLAPENLIVLSGDHIYRMDYRLLLDYHREKAAEATVAVIEVPWTEAPRFGILTARPGGAIADFAEKPARPRSNLASMGVYIFNWRVLKEYLTADERNPASNHDFGKNVIPAMLAGGAKLFAYPFAGYWRDVGTVDSLYEAHMDLLAEKVSAVNRAGDWPLHHSGRRALPPTMVLDKKRKSLISRDAVLAGEITGSVVAAGVQIGEKAVIKDSVLMPGARIGGGTYIERAIIGSGAFIGAGCVVLGNPIAAVSENSLIAPSRVGPAYPAVSVGA